MLSILDKSFDSNTTIKDKITYIDASNHLTSFRTNNNNRDFQNVITKLKVLLASESTRLEGLVLLKTVLIQCQTDTFSNSAMFWANSCLDVFKSADSCFCKQLAGSIFIIIIQNLPKVPKLLPEVSKKIIPSLIPTLLQNTSEDEWILVSTKCLVVVMQTFPALLTSYRNDIENFLLSMMDNVVCSDAVADCFAALPSCGERCSKSRPRKIHEIWSQQFLKLIVTQHCMLDEFLFYIEDAQERAKYECSKENVFLLPQLPENFFNSHFVQARLIVTLSKCITKMMSSNQVKNVVQFPVEGVFAVAVRVLVVPVESIQNDNSAELNLMFSLLPEIRCAALEILESLIRSCKTILVDKARFIGSLLLEKLKNSRKVYTMSLFRAAVINVLVVWLNNNGRKGQFGTSILHEIINELLDCITPEKLREVTPAPEPKTKTTDVDKTTSQLAEQETVTKEICDDSIPSLFIKALKGLTTIVYVEGNSLDSKVLEVIQKKVIFILNAIRRKTAHPYSDARCRKSLYQLLLATVVTSNRYLRQSLNAAAIVFKLGLSDSSERVSRFCTQAFTILKPTMNPSRAAPPLPIAVKELPNGRGGHHMHDKISQMERLDNAGMWSGMNGPRVPRYGVSEDRYRQQGSSNEMEEDDIQYSPRASSPLGMVVFNREDERNGDIDHGLQQGSSHRYDFPLPDMATNMGFNLGDIRISHEDAECEEEESEEDMEDEESSEVEELDNNGRPVMVEEEEEEGEEEEEEEEEEIEEDEENDNDDMPEYATSPPPNDNPSELPPEDFSEAVAAIACEYGEQQLQMEQDIVVVKNEAGYSVNQNGMYATSEEDADVSSSVRAPTPQMKRSLENSLESSPKRRNAISTVPEEPTDAEPIEEEKELSAMDMLKDFDSRSPDENDSQQS